MQQRIAQWICLHANLLVLFALHDIWLIQRSPLSPQLLLPGYPSKHICSSMSHVCKHNLRFFSSQTCIMS